MKTRQEHKSEEKIKIKSKKIPIQVNPENDEHAKRLESESIEKELSFYDSRPKLQEMDEDIKIAEAEPIILDDAPNPFSKKNKISKFQPSQTNTANVVVKSKFFHEESVVDDLPLSQGSNIENDLDNANRLSETPSTSQDIADVEDEVVEIKEESKSEVTNKKSNIGRCKKVGLKRKSSQQTIHSFFSKMKKI